MSDELKKIGDRMVSAILVANPAPHILWGTDELKIFIGCEDAKLRGHIVNGAYQA